MKFHFPLQKVVDLKGHEKAQAEWQLSQALSELNQGELDLGELLQERSHAAEKLNQKATTYSIYELQSMQRYLASIDRKIKEKQAQVQLAHKKVKQEKKELEYKMIDEKKWNQAREKAFFLFKHSKQQKEQAEIDDLAITRFADS